jgi:hypothetical protein
MTLIAFHGSERWIDSLKSKMLAHQTAASSQSLKGQGQTWIERRMPAMDV